MKQISLFLTAGFMLGTSMAVTAGEDLANSSGCLACHAIDAQAIGPAYKDVAAKYRDQDGAVEMLVQKVKSGGTGNWGSMPMPPNAHVKDEDIQSIVEWILSL